MDGIPLGTLGIGSGWLIVCLFVMQMMRGRLHPQSTIDRMVADHTRQLDDSNHDRDEWRAAHRISETARVEQGEQLGRLTDGFGTVESFIRALPHPDRSPG